MEIHQLRYFCAIVRAGSFTRAAEQLGIAQPSLSQQIRRLEKKIGSPLFERLGRSVKLTASGQELNQTAPAILRQVAEAECRIADLREGVRGRLRIGVIPTIMPYLVAPRISAFLKQYPEVDLQFIEDTTARLLEYLQSAEVDLAVAGLPVRNEDVICSELFREELYMVVPTGHRFARQPAVNLQEVKSERLLLLKEGHCLREDVLKACTRGKAELHSVFETNQMESIFQLVKSGFGVSLVPEMASRHATACSLVCLKTNHQRRVGYLRARRHMVSKPMREFISWLKSMSNGKSKS